jgi:hypothetical protein
VAFLSIPELSDFPSIFAETAPALEPVQATYFARSKFDHRSHYVSRWSGDLVSAS